MSSARGLEPRPLFPKRTNHEATAHSPSPVVIPLITLVVIVQIKQDYTQKTQRQHSRCMRVFYLKKRYLFTTSRSSVYQFSSSKKRNVFDHGFTTRVKTCNHELRALLITFRSRDEKRQFISTGTLQLLSECHTFQRRSTPSWSTNVEHWCDSLKRKRLVEVALQVVEFSFNIWVYSTCWTAHFSV